MKHSFYITAMVFSILLGCGACGNMNDFPTLAEKQEEQEDTTATDSDTLAIDTTHTDTIEIDETPLENESETVLTPTNGMYKDFLANFIYDEDDLTDWNKYQSCFDATTQEWSKGVKTLTITFTDDAVTYSYKSKKGKEGDYEASDFTISTSGANITVTAHTKCNYVLKGSSSSGSFKLYTDSKCIITLDGISLTNPNGAAINIQKGNDGGKRTFIVVANDTKNYLTDGTTYTTHYYPGTTTEEDEKGVIFSEGKILISGGGYLRVNGNGKNAIACDDYLYLHKGPQLTLYPAADNDGIKAKDGIYIGGGVLNIVCSGDNAKGLNTDSLLWINGGRTIIKGAATPMKYGTSQIISGTIKY